MLITTFPKFWYEGHRSLVMRLGSWAQPSSLWVLIQETSDPIITPWHARPLSLQERPVCPKWSLKISIFASRYQSLQNCCKIFNVFDCFASTRRYRVKKIHSAKCFSTLPQNTTAFEIEVNWFTICAMPLFVKIYLACISPYSISAACSIRSLWWLSSNSSSNENKKKEA